MKLIKRGFFSVASLFILLSAISLTIIHLAKAKFELTPAKRIDDDVKALRYAKELCERGKYQKQVKDKYIVEIELKPPETKTREKRKIVFNQECNPVEIIY